MEGTSQAVVGSSDQQKVPASLSLFLKSERIPVLLNEEKDLTTGSSMNFNLFPWPMASGTDLKSWKGLYSGPSPINNCYSGLSTGLATDANGQVSVVHWTAAFSSAEV